MLASIHCFLGTGQAYFKITSNFDCIHCVMKMYNYGLYKVEGLTLMCYFKVLVPISRERVLIPCNNFVPGVQGICCTSHFSDDIIILLFQFVVEHTLYPITPCRSRLMGFDRPSSLIYCLHALIDTIEIIVKCLDFWTITPPVTRGILLSLACSIRPSFLSL